MYYYKCNSSHLLMEFLSHTFVKAKYFLYLFCMTAFCIIGSVKVESGILIQNSLL